MSTPRIYDHDEICRLYRSGLGYADIKAAIGVSYRVIQRVLERNGIPRRPKHVNIRSQRGQPRGQAIDRQKVADLCGQGLTVGEIAVRMNCGRSTVREILKKLGLKAKRPTITVRPKRPPKAPQPKRLAPKVVVLPNDPRPTSEIVAEFLRAGGKITRCPTVAVLPTTADIRPDETIAERNAKAAHADYQWTAVRDRERAA